MADTDKESPRLAAMREFCDRQGWELNTWSSTQREPGDGLSIRLGNDKQAIRIKSESYDSMDVAIARMEDALGRLADANRDVYLRERPADWGRL